ncbi:hypothetical protein F4778DRAFT_743525 [Xylariomycetidae sp. FL2044]|nr:hypothetical protein F4778DRAFT_743525 [Xylariomycetidae sp. FL2044]
MVRMMSWGPIMALLSRPVGLLLSLSDVNYKRQPSLVHGTATAKELVWDDSTIVSLQSDKSITAGLQPCLDPFNVAIWDFDAGASYPVQFSPFKAAIRISISVMHNNLLRHLHDRHIV